MKNLIQINYAYLGGVWISYYHEGILFNYFFSMDMHMGYMYLVLLSDIQYMSLLLSTGKVIILHEKKKKKKKKRSEVNNYTKTYQYKHKYMVE